jgi:hypothetical protein
MFGFPHAGRHVPTLSSDSLTEAGSEDLAKVVVDRRLDDRARAAKTALAEANSARGDDHTRIQVPPPLIPRRLPIPPERAPWPEEVMLASPYGRLGSLLAIASLTAE